MRFPQELRGVNVGRFLAEDPWVGREMGGSNEGQKEIQVGRGTSLRLAIGAEKSRR